MSIASATTYSSPLPYSLLHFHPFSRFQLPHRRRRLRRICSFSSLLSSLQARAKGEKRRGKRGRELPKQRRSGAVQNSRLSSKTAQMRETFVPKMPLTSVYPVSTVCLKVEIRTSSVSWFGPRTDQEPFVVQLPPSAAVASSLLEPLQPPYQSLVAYWSKQEEMRRRRRRRRGGDGCDGEQAEKRENSAERPLIRRRLRDF